MDSMLGRLHEIAPDTLDLRALARMVTQALPEFYESIPLSPDAVLDLIADEMRTGGTECHNPLVALVGGPPVAVICAFPLAELSSRQQGSLLQIMRRLDRIGRKVFRDIATKSLSIAPVEVEDARYIARITVADGMRGKGIGKRIFADFAAIEPDRPIALHVDRGNEAAIRYYHGLGFRLAGSKDFRKLAMVWHPTADEHLP